MAKFYGTVGFASTVETSRGVWEEQISERKYYGDEVRVLHRFNTPSDQVNRDVDVSNEISILADTYANGHIHELRYVVWKGVKWEITQVSVQLPRIVLTIGGVYHAQSNGSSDPSGEHTEQ